MKLFYFISSELVTVFILHFNLVKKITVDFLLSRNSKFALKGITTTTKQIPNLGLHKLIMSSSCLGDGNSSVPVTLGTWARQASHRMWTFL